MATSSAFESRCESRGYPLSEFPVDLPARENILKGLFIITGLAVGGGETVLLRLLSRMDRGKFASTVISLQGGGPLGERIRELGIPVYEMNWGRRLPGSRALQKHAQALRGIRPDFVQGWMIHGNLAAEISRLCCKRTPVLWNMRHSLDEFALLGSSGSINWSTSALVRLLGRMSSRPAKVIYNSRSSARQHESVGYDPRRTVVIPNGFDCESFRPRPECRPRLRASLGLAKDAHLIGMIARVHPVKDHENFLRAARRLVSRGVDAHFVLVGKGTTSESIAARIQALELQAQVHALGERLDVPELMAALDVAVCSSKSEAFPNTVGEAMACGVPCVVTDVGDSAWMVGDTGRIVPICDPAALSDSVREILELDTGRRSELGRAARARIVQEFSMDRIVSRYEQLYQEVVHH